MEAVINTIGAKFEEVISKWVEDILVPVDERIHDLCKVLASKVQGWNLHIEAVRYSLRTKSGGN
jgi:hypothetical protein